MKEIRNKRRKGVESMEAKERRWRLYESGMWALSLGTRPRGRRKQGEGKGASSAPADVLKRQDERHSNPKEQRRGNHGCERETVDVVHELDLAIHWEHHDQQPVWNLGWAALTPNSCGDARTKMATEISAKDLQGGIAPHMP